MPRPVCCSRSAAPASASAALLGAAAPLAYHEERDYALVDQELRIASTADRRLSWIVGLSYLHSTITVAGALRPPGDATVMGKAAGKDAMAGKTTFVTLLGADAARERLGLLKMQTKSHLDPFGGRADFLRDSVDFVLERRQ
eukprot:gene33650-45069_t